MNDMKRAFLRSIGPALDSDDALTGTAETIGRGILRKQAADKRRPADKGWDTKLSFKTYQKLHSQGVV